MKRMLTAHTFQVCSLLEGTSSQEERGGKNLLPGDKSAQCDNLTALNTVQTHLQAEQSP